VKKTGVYALFTCKTSDMSNHCYIKITVFKIGKNSVLVLCPECKVHATRDGYFSTKHCVKGNSMVLD